MSQQTLTYNIPDELDLYIEALKAKQGEVKNGVSIKLNATELYCIASALADKLINVRVYQLKDGKDTYEKDLNEVKNLLKRIEVELNLLNEKKEKD